MYKDSFSLSLCKKTFSIMSTLELKQELHKYIDKGDNRFVKYIYDKIKAYQTQLEQDKMIAEGEEDIKAGRLHTQQEIKDFIDNWEA